MNLNLSLTLLDVKIVHFLKIGPGGFGTKGFAIAVENLPSVAISTFESIVFSQLAELSFYAMLSMMDDGVLCIHHFIFSRSLESQ